MEHVISQKEIRDVEPSRPLILVVDDSPNDLHLAASLLRSLFCVVAVQTGAEALKQLKQERPSVLLTDLVMPEIDGLTLVEEVRAAYPTLPIILMTTDGSEELAMRALRAGAASYLPKRALVSDLVTTVEHVFIAAQHDRRHSHVLECISFIECQFELDNDPAQVPHLISHIQEQMVRMKLCGENVKIRLGVALEEALLNGLYHGNLELSSELRQDGTNRFYDLAAERRQQSPYRDRRLHVRVRLHAKEAHFTIRDEGPGFDPTKLPDPALAESQMLASGRGLLLIRTFMDEAVHNARGNEITMVKRFSEKA